MAVTQISPIVLPLEVAQRVTETAIEKAEQLGVPYTLTVLDGSGNLVYATRMDGAAIASIDTSLAKARTSVFFGAATSDLAAAVTSGSPLATIETATEQKLAFVAGGVPIKDAKGVVIGAIGAGGGTPAQDDDVAQTAVSSL